VNQGRDQAVVAQRYELDAWRGKDPDGPGVFHWHFRPRPDSLPGWRPLRVEPIAAAQGWPPVVQSIWGRDTEASPKAEEEEALVSLWLFEAPATEAVRDVLLRLLADFQAPDLERLRLGDIGFAAPGSGGALFAVGNLVVLLRNAGSVGLDAVELARTWQRELTEPPESVSKVVPEIHSFRVRPSTNRAFELAVEATDPLGEELSYSFFFSSGEVYASGDTLLYRPGERPEVTLYVVNRLGGVASQRLELES